MMPKELDCSSSDPYDLEVDEKCNSLSASPAMLSISPEKPQFYYNNLNPNDLSLVKPNSPLLSPALANGDSFVGVSSEGQSEVMSIESVRKRLEVVHTFPCHEIGTDGKLIPSFLSCTSAHMFILHQVPHSPTQVLLKARRALNSIVRITSKKSRPEVMTFCYGVRHEDSQQVQICASERFLIPNAEETVKRIEKLICEIMQSFAS